MSAIAYRPEIDGLRAVAAGPVVLERVLDRYPVQRIGEREAA